MNPHFGRRNAIYWRLIYSIHSILDEVCYYRVFESPFHLLSSRLLHDDGAYGKISAFHERGPLPHLIYCEVSSLIRSSAVWNTVMVGKAFRKSTDGGFGRSTACQEGKFLPTTSAYSLKQSTALPVAKAVQDNQPATR